MKRLALAPARRPRAAFTILEVLVAMSILLIGMSSILGLLAFGAALSRNAALRSSGASAVEAVVADLEESFFPLVKDPQSGESVVGAPEAVTDRALPGHPGLTYSARAVPDPRDTTTPGGALRWRVDVEIHWTSAGEQRAKTFSTLLLRQVPFGERLRRELIQSEPAPPAPAATKEPKKP